jgi:NADPH-dependent glutamate synthase beta subunit-like oxidoreductase
MPHLCHDDERNCTFSEVEGALTEGEALTEADRCLRCGLVCYDRDLAEDRPAPTTNA